MTRVINDTVAKEFMDTHEDFLEFAEVYELAKQVERQGFKSRLKIIKFEITYIDGILHRQLAYEINKDDNDEIRPSEESV